MKNNSDDEENLVNEKRKFILSLRKRKINFKLFEGRNLPVINNKNEFNIFNENSDISINNIKLKFREILLLENSNEDNFLKILQELYDNLASIFKTDNIKEISEEIIESQVIHKIYTNLLVNEYINNKEILSKVLIIFSIILYLYNHFPNLKIYKNEFIPKEIFINLISLLLKSDDEEIIYYTYKFIVFLVKDSDNISKKLYEYELFEQIINNKQFEDNLDIVTIKICLISNFELFSEYNKNKQLSLNIQKFYISIYNEYIRNKNFENEIFEYFIKTIKAVSYCFDDDYIRNLLDSKIITFLLNLDENKNLFIESLLAIIGNMSLTQNEDILQEIYKEVIQYLINKIKSDKSNEYIMGLTLWNINNFATNKNLCCDIFFDKNLILIYQDYIIKQEIIDENIFNEICFSYKNIILTINEDKKYFLIKEHNLISLVIDGFKKIKNINNYIKTGKRIVEVLFLLFTIKDSDVCDYNKFTFENKGGVEYILDKISNILLEENNIENGVDESDERINKEEELLSFINFIKNNLLEQ